MSLTVGILGGGQLARMMVLAGAPLGLRFELYDPAADACSGPLAPLTVGAFVLMALGFARWTRRQWRGEQRMTAAPAWLLYGLFWLIMGFWVARNIPGWTWLSPA